MKTYIFIPPTKGSTGGIAVLFQVGKALNGGEYEAVFVLRERSAWIEKALEDQPYVMWDDAEPTPEDIWLIPEGWVNALSKGLNSGARCINYVQNWAYLHSALPEGVQWNTLPVSFVGVSEPVSRFVQEALRLEEMPPVLRPGIDLKRFSAPDRVQSSGKIKIAYMPRKNKALALQIKAIFEARNPDLPVRFVEIENMTPDQVAATLKSSQIFLVTGFPEGCPLPPLEAMASGCVPVGFAGYGGWDYMRHPKGQGRQPNYAPWFSLREDISWEGNGLWCADGDVLDCALQLEEAVNWFVQAQSGTVPVALADILQNVQKTAQAYSEEVQIADILGLWGIF
ncbi:MAG: glycosyltransferase family 1 protein [Desulfovibrio sp.]